MVSFCVCFDFFGALIHRRDRPGRRAGKVTSGKSVKVESDSFLEQGERGKGREKGRECRSG